MSPARSRIGGSIAPSFRPSLMGAWMPISSSSSEAWWMSEMGTSPFLASERGPSQVLVVVEVVVGEEDEGA